jgi:hypothetical protein
MIYSVLMSIITKQSAIEMALLLNAPGDLRAYLVCSINRVFERNKSLELEKVCRRLETLCRDDDNHKLTALLHYMVCLRLENINPNDITN